MKPLISLPANILVVDDVLDNLEILRDLLTFHGYNVLTASNGEEALECAREAHPDLILLDIIMPHMDGFEVSSLLKADEVTQNIPIIFVSSLADAENTVKAFQAGGVDYIIKPYQQAEILARINTHIVTLRLHRQLEEQNAELERLASTDSLTGVSNRRRFFKIAESKFRESVRSGMPISVSLFDVDHYKAINDANGHMTGDQVLTHLARLLRSLIRDEDVIARYGGDEFIVLHVSLDKHGAYEVADTIRQRVQENPFVSERREIRLTLSVGVEDTLGYKEDSHFDEFLSKADQALYLAKRSGRNRVMVYQENDV